MEDLYKDLSEVLEKRKQDKLFNDTQEIAEVPTNATKEDIWNDIKYRTKDLKELEELRYTVENVLPELKDIFEKEYSNLIKEIKGLSAKYKKAKARS